MYIYRSRSEDTKPKGESLKTIVDNRPIARLLQHCIITTLPFESRNCYYYW